MYNYYHLTSNDGKNNLSVKSRQCKLQQIHYRAFCDYYLNLISIIKFILPISLKIPIVISPLSTDFQIETITSYLYFFERRKSTNVSKHQIPFWVKQDGQLVSYSIDLLTRNKILTYTPIEYVLKFYVVIQPVFFYLRTKIIQ